MGVDEQQQQQPARVYRDLRVVADQLEHEGHVVFGVIYEGAFVPLGHRALGDLEAMKRRWNDLGGVHATAEDAETVQSLETRLAQLERAALANGWQLDQQQQPPPPPPSE